MIVTATEKIRRLFHTCSSENSLHQHPFLCLHKLLSVTAVITTPSHYIVEHSVLIITKSSRKTLGSSPQPGPTVKKEYPT